MRELQALPSLPTAFRSLHAFDDLLWYMAHEHAVVTAAHQAKKRRCAMPPPPPGKALGKGSQMKARGAGRAQAAEDERRAEEQSAEGAG